MDTCFCFCLYIRNYRLIIHFFLPLGKDLSYLFSTYPVSPRACPCCMRLTLPATVSQTSAMPFYLSATIPYNSYIHATYMNRPIPFQPNIRKASLQYHIQKSCLLQETADKSLVAVRFTPVTYFQTLLFNDAFHCYFLEEQRPFTYLLWREFGHLPFLLCLITAQLCIQ